MRGGDNEGFGNIRMCVFNSVTLQRKQVTNSGIPFWEDFETHPRILPKSFCIIPDSQIYKTLLIFHQSRSVKACNVISDAEYNKYTVHD